MDYQKLEEAFLQGGEKEASALFNELLRVTVRKGLLGAMQQEVESLCGPRHHPDSESSCHRAGSEKGTAYLNGEKEAIIRPRVRHEDEGEVNLVTYQAASNQRNVFEQVVAAVGQGLPIRGAGRIHRGTVSKSAASRMWVEKSLEQLDLLRTRDLTSFDCLCIMIDGVWLNRDTCVVVAIGVGLDGVKQVLDFEQGSSESKVVVEDLIHRLAKRGLIEREDRRLLVVRDGSAAIAGAVAKCWPAALQQECLVHGHQNLKKKLRKRDLADLDRLMTRLREAQGKVAGEEAFDEVLDYVSERNAAAGLTLKDRRDALLCFHRLDVVSTLNTTFLSTNLIENVFRNWRQATGNVKVWKEGGDMVPRWVASGLLWAEAGFRKISHYGDLPRLAAALSSSAASSSLRSSSPAEDDNAGSKESCKPKD